MKPLHRLFFDKRVIKTSLLAMGMGAAAVWLWLERPGSLVPPQEATPLCGLKTEMEDKPMPVIHPGTAGSVTMDGLPPGQDVLWEKVPGEPAFAAFHGWTQKYAAIDGAEKPAAVEEGKMLAAERRAALRQMIRQNPERALELAVPEAVRRAMPPAVKLLLEERIDDRGDLHVTAAAGNGREQPGGRPVVRREAKLPDGRRLEAFVYGQREYQPSRWGIPLHGIVLDGDMAVTQWPGRVLEPVERADAKLAMAADPLCDVSGQPAAGKGTETALKQGREVEFYCGPSHARQVLTTDATEEIQLPPGFGARPQSTQNAASGGAGQTVPSLLAEGNSTWTTGAKKILVVRVKFPASYDENQYSDYTDLSSSDCSAIVDGIRSAFSDWSFNRLTIAPVQAGGSKVSSVVALDDSAADYTGDDIGGIWDEVKDKVGSQGINPDNYHFILVLAGDAPITDEDDDTKTVWWGGLGRIGEGLSFIRVNDPAYTAQERIDRNVSVSLHELGHNLGLYHSSTIYTQPYINGYVIEVGAEYGDRYDRMGKGGGDFNVRYKQWLNWLDNANVPLAVTDGVYTIREHDLEEKTGVRGLQISTLPFIDFLSSENQLFVEYRLDNVQAYSNGAFPYVKHNFPLRAFGAQVRLGKPGSPKTWLQDTTPETPNWEPGDDTSGNVDAPLLPGRTYSFTRNGNTVFLTNLSADPESGELEVEVQHGTPAGNHAPSGTMVSSTPQGAKDQKILFTASVADADGDELAYHWQVPSLDYDSVTPAVFPNSSSLSVSFKSTGTKLVRCIVSDKHGGVVTLTKNFSIIVNSPPAISAIADQTMDEDGSILNLPFTVSDSTTPGGSLTVTVTSDNTTLFPAAGMVLGTVSGGSRRISLTPPANRHGTAKITLRVTDGTLIDFEQFTVTVRPVTPGTALVSSGDLWRYWDKDSTPAGNWKVTNYDDSAWLQNNSRFVYNMGLLIPAPWTELAAPGRSRTTCYFRRTFIVPGSPAGTLTLKLLADDGAVVYLNGLEVYRRNMPEGDITGTTRAASSMEGLRQTAWTTVPLSTTSVHLGGINSISVEVHDSGSRGAGDVAFDCQLAFLNTPSVSALTDRTSPEDTVAGPYSVTGFDAESPPGPITFAATSSNPGLVQDADIKFGLSAYFAERFITCTPQPNASGSTVITVKVSDGSSETWRSFTLTVTPVNDPPAVEALPDMGIAMGEPAPAVEIKLSDVDTPLNAINVTASSSNTALVPNSGLQILPGSTPGQRWLVISPVAAVSGETVITVNANDGGATTGDSFVFRVSSPLAVTSSDVSLVRSGGLWRYWAGTLPLDAHGQPVDFTDPALYDRAWPSGRSRLGYGGDGEVTAVPVTPYRITTYFRHTFTVPDAASVSQLKLRLLRDDGALVYLNGILLQSSNMPRATITATTPASTDVSGTAESAWSASTETTAALRTGTNVIAVEVHQSAQPTAFQPGDLSFDLELDGVPVLPPASDVLVAPGEMWSFWDKGEYPDDTWKLATFFENQWGRGLARLGYGIGGESTVVNKDNAAGSGRNPSVLLRKVFDVATPSIYTGLHLFLQRDDGLAVYLNGTRILSDNIAGGATLSDFAASETGPGEHLSWHHYFVDRKYLISGRNLVAVELHQSSISGTDLTFDMQLTGSLTSDPPPLFMKPAAGGFELSWPAAYSGWQPWASADAGQTPWTPLAESMLSDAGWIYVYPASGESRRFFRLQKP